MELLNTSISLVDNIDFIYERIVYEEKYNFGRFLGGVFGRFFGGFFGGGLGGFLGGWL